MAAKNPRRSNPSRFSRSSSYNPRLRHPRKNRTRNPTINPANPNKKDAPITTWTPSYRRSRTKKRTRSSKPSRTTWPPKLSNVWRRRNPFPSFPDHLTPPDRASVKAANATYRSSKPRWLPTTSRSTTARASSSPQKKQRFPRKRLSFVARPFRCPLLRHPSPPYPAAPK